VRQRQGWAAACEWGPRPALVSIYRVNPWRLPGVQRVDAPTSRILVNIQHMWIVHLVVSFLALAVITYVFVLT
jgi:hypothetical protein